MNNASEPSILLAERLNSRMDWLFFRELSLSLDMQGRQLAFVSGSFALWCAVFLRDAPELKEDFQPNDIDIYTKGLSLTEILAFCGSFAANHNE